MNEFERLRELIKENPNVPVVVKFKAMPQKNFDCRYYMTEGYVYNENILTEDEYERQLFDELRNNGDYEDISDYRLSRIVSGLVRAAESAKIISVEVW